MDRGAGVRTVLDLLMNLEAQAAKAGGRVDVILGNHEAMNLLGDTRDVNPELFRLFTDAQSEARRTRGFAAARRIRGSAITDTDKDAWMAAHPPGFIEYREAFGPNGRYGKWLRSKPVVGRVDGTVFMHAGIDPQWPASSIDEINERARKEISDWDEAVTWMERQQLIAPFATLREAVAAAEAEYARLSTREGAPNRDDERALRYLTTVATINSSSLRAAGGPLWFRGFDTWTDEEGTPLMQALMRKYRAERFVTGHSVQKDGRIRARFGGWLFLIDTGMVFPGGRASALEILGDKVTPMYADDPGRPGLTEW
jgi:hypothetical protein